MDCTLWLSLAAVYKEELELFFEVQSASIAIDLYRIDVITSLHEKYQDDASFSLFITVSTVCERETPQSSMIMTHLTIQVTHSKSPFRSSSSRFRKFVFHKK